MLDIKLIRETPEIVRENLKKRGDKEKLGWLDEIIEKDKQWRKLVIENDKLKHKRNLLSQEIAELKKAGKGAAEKLKEAAKIPGKIKENDVEIQKLQDRCKWILMRLPNILHESVPIGKDENENVEIKEWGKKPKFDFKPKNHLELAENLGLIDTERAAKVSGHGFYYLKDKLALLDQAILRFTIDFMIKKGEVVIDA